MSLLIASLKPISGFGPFERLGLRMRVDPLVGAVNVAIAAAS